MAALSSTFAMTMKLPAVDVGVLFIHGHILSLFHHLTSPMLLLDESVIIDHPRRHASYVMVTSYQRVIVDRAPPRYRHFVEMVYRTTAA